MNRDIDPIDDVAAETAPTGRSVIAVIGIDRYRLVRRLTNAVGDARAALEVFQRLGFEQAVPPLFDDAASAVALNRLVSDDLAELGPDDNLVLFFAGHGTTTTRSFPDGLTIKTGYLLPVEAGSSRDHAAAWVKLESWLEDVSRLPPRHILVILDACHSGIALGPLIKWRGGAPPVPAALDPLRRLRSRRIITSALEDQVAMDGGPVPGHSLFTGCLIEALTGGLARDGAFTTGSALGVYLQQRVTNYPQSQQTPDFGALALDARGEMVIPISGAKSAAASRAAVAQEPVAAPGATLTETGHVSHGPAIEAAPQRADVIVLTATPLDFDAVLQVDAGNGPPSSWDLASGPSGLPIAFRTFTTERRSRLRIAVAVSADCGASVAANTLLPLAALLQPQSIAMCGTCIGHSGKTRLGDVIVADRLYYQDVGKQLSDEVQHDLTTYMLRDDWKIAIERMDPVAHFRDASWFKARPISTEWRELRALVALRDRAAAPWTVVDPTLTQRDWSAILASLRQKQLLPPASRQLTDKAVQFIDDLLFAHMGQLPDLSPVATFEPFQLHVGPIATGSKVIADAAIWDELSHIMYATLGIETEAAAIGELAHRQRQYHLDAIAMKGIASFADRQPDDRFRAFAARASAECLLWFLRSNC